jgi:hypothetical protein
MKRKALFYLAAILMVLPPIASLSDASNKKGLDAAATVKAFYAFHFKHNFDYTERGLEQRRRWLDENLYKLLTAELKRSKQSASQNEAPELNGDPFTNSQEYPSAFRIAKSEQGLRKATVEVVFVWKEKDRVIDEKRIRVDVLRHGASWKIANINAGEEGDLVKFLNRQR